MIFRRTEKEIINHSEMNTFIRVVKEVREIISQFPYNSDTKLYHCTKCNCCYKSRRYKNGNLNNHVVKHSRKICFPKLTRNHRKCSNGEKRCKKVLKELFPGSDIIRGSNKVLKDELGKRFPKADYIVDYSIRVQFKLDPYVYIHNWIETSHIQYAKDIWGIHDIYERLVDIILKFEEDIVRRLQNYRKSKRNRETKDAKLYFISFVVKRVSDNNYRKSPSYIKITDLNTKKLFLHWDKNENDKFHYMYGTDMTLFKLTDEIINNMNIIYEIRPVYTTSGDTQFSHENIFKDDTDICEMIDRVNNIDFV